MTPEQRFLLKVDRQAGCWQWTAARDRAGYGKAWFDGRLWQAHRVAYTLWVGSIPDGLVIDHLCCNKSCVNPSHLEAVPHRVNTMRAGTSMSAINARKTHCSKGHPLDATNTYQHKGNGQRRCRACHIAEVGAYKKKRRQST